MLYAFPGGDTGKRWHIMHDEADPTNDMSWRWLISTCKKFEVTKYWKNNNQASYAPIIRESTDPPMPLCAHCKRLSGK